MNASLQAGCLPTHFSRLFTVSLAIATMRRPLSNAVFLSYSCMSNTKWLSGSRGRSKTWWKETLGEVTQVVTELPIQQLWFHQKRHVFVVNSWRPLTASYNLSPKAEFMGLTPGLTGRITLVWHDEISLATGSFYSSKTELGKQNMQLSIVQASKFMHPKFKWSVEQ